MSAYDRLRQHLREAQTLISAAEVLGWDQETQMPRKAAPLRAEQKSMLSTLAHERCTDPRVGDWLAECEADAELTADAAVRANLREIRRTYDRSVKLPVELVAAMSETSSLAMEAWREARSQGDFARFLPWLEKQLELNRRKAACWGIPAGGEPYDALLDDYEPETRAADLERIFKPLRAELAPLLATLTAGPKQPNDDVFKTKLPIERQHAFNLEVLGRLGFDLDAGRLDTSTHPFSIGIGPGDTRITTRYRDDAMLDALGSTLHEAGHALYEQGLPKQSYPGQPLGEPLGLGIHESQSRLWENHVGRSLEFCRWVLPEMQRHFGAPLRSVTTEQLYAAVNTVRPNLIRVESDEVTYHFHIMLRFDLERAMLEGDLSPAELPGAWNERMRADLGLDVPDDRRGCLQDVHWSMGAIGYFPTYTLGSLYAAQLWETVVDEAPQVPAEIARGDFSTLLAWLRRGVHAHGRRYPAAELCRKVTGKPLDPMALIRHLDRKLRPIYGLETSA